MDSTGLIKGQTAVYFYNVWLRKNREFLKG
jgi:hypothetical protein